MKNIQLFICAGVIFLILSLSSGCSKILEEEPRHIYTPEYFKTERGVKGGITSLYARLRWLYGQAYYYNSVLTGTDEATWAQSADGNFRDADMSGVGNITPTTSRSDVLWDNSYYNINTASGIIEYGGEVGVADVLIAEAYFFRGFDYFLLVQTFGGVPLDLGAGELKFNTSTSAKSVRNTVSEVYTKAIFPDLLKAINDLPESQTIIGKVTKNTARLVLAKAYLTYGWWLQNPNNIPTYPETARTDPNGQTAQWYFQQAYNLAVQGIDNPGPYALQPTYYDVHWAPNDRNNEMMLFADHTETSEFYNGASLTWGNGGAPDNFAVWMYTWNYTNIRSSTSNTSWTAVSSVQREASQHLGRPWTRMAPPQGVFTNTFADKTNDSRYDGTFTTVYRGNWNLLNTGLTNTPTLYNANMLPVTPGQAILTFLNENSNTAVDYSGNKGNVGAGALPGRADFVIEPAAISRLRHPGLWKLGTYRTDNNGSLGEPNAGTTRPFNVLKFSEFYFVAAEAAVKGAAPQAGKTARDLINVIRARAGKWRWDNNGNVAKVQDNSAAMMAATPATITIDYILAERSREYFGEGYRWFDLVRTQKWAEVAGTYRIAGTGVNDHVAQNFNRTIQPFHYLRPIPQRQLDLMEATPAEKKAYQNPGYD